MKKPFRLPIKKAASARPPPPSPWPTGWHAAVPHPAGRPRPAGSCGLFARVEKAPGLVPIDRAGYPLEKGGGAMPVPISTSCPATSAPRRSNVRSPFRISARPSWRIRCASHYDFVLLDMAPSLDVLHLNGLVACNWVIIPTRLDALAVDGVKEILLTMGEISPAGLSL